MTQSEQIALFEADLDALVSRYALEFDMPYAAVIGVLQIKAHELCAQACEEQQEDDDDDDSLEDA